MEKLGGTQHRSGGIIYPSVGYRDRPISNAYEASYRPYLSDETLVLKRDEKRQEETRRDTSAILARLDLTSSRAIQLSFALVPRSHSLPWYPSDPTSPLSRSYPYLARLRQ